MKSETVRIEVSIIFLSLQNVFNSSLRMGILEFKVFHQPFVWKFLKLFGSVNFPSKTIKALLILNNSYFDGSRSIHLAIVHSKIFQTQINLLTHRNLRKTLFLHSGANIFYFSSSNQRVGHSWKEKEDGKVIWRKLQIQLRNNYPNWEFSSHIR